MSKQRVPLVQSPKNRVGVTKRRRSTASRAGQLSLPGLEKGPRRAVHGGELARGRRKEARPFDSKQAVHVVLRSGQARGQYSLLHPRHCNAIRDFLRKTQSKWNVRVYRFANVGNHLHLLVRARSRREWQGFIREFSGGVAMMVTGARKGMAHTGGPRNSRVALPGTERGFADEVRAQRSFWDHLVFSRLVPFGRAFDRAARYVSMNLMESFGIPVRRFLARGFHVFEMSDDGFLLVHPPGASGFS